MLTRRVIPCLDVRDGRVVKGVRFANLRDAGDPVQQAERYQQQGADEIVILDVSATPQHRSHAIDIVKAVRAVLSIPLTVGGGVRSVDNALALLAAGADKVSINTAAVHNPPLLAEIAHRVGTQCVVLALDAARSHSLPDHWEVVTRCGQHRTGIDALAWARHAKSLGVGEILLTSFDRDGTREGYDLALVRAMASSVRLPIIASGGAATPLHMVEALKAGADAVLAASIFHDAEITVNQLKTTLAAHGLEMRT